MNINVSQKLFYLRNKDKIDRYIKELKQIKINSMQHINIVNNILISEKDFRVLLLLYPYIISGNILIKRLDNKNEILYGIDIKIFKNHLLEIIKSISYNVHWEIFINECWQYIYYHKEFDEIFEVILKKMRKSIDTMKRVHLDEEERTRKQMMNFLNKCNGFNGKRKNIIENEIVSAIFEIDTDKLKKQKLLEPFKGILKELASSENKTIYDYEAVSAGSFRLTFRVGEKVIKTINKGAEERIEKLEYNKYLLLPLIRKVVKGTGIGFEIYENVDPIKLTETSKNKEKRVLIEEITYQIFSDLRDMGLVWLDVHPRNIGRLRQDNKVYFKNRPDIILDCEATKIYNNNKIRIETLKKGEYIILDNDFIYEDSYFEEIKKDFYSGYLEIPLGFYFIEFDKRYHDSKKNKQKKYNKFYN